jgi:hypothetical protein
MSCLLHQVFRLISSYQKLANNDVQYIYPLCTRLAFLTSAWYAKLVVFHHELRFRLFFKEGCDIQASGSVPINKTNI